jgi:hypothetical protein
MHGPPGISLSSALPPRSLSLHLPPSSLPSLPPTLPPFSYLSLRRHPNPGGRQVGRQRRRSGSTPAVARQCFGFIVPFIAFRGTTEISRPSGYSDRAHVFQAAGIGNPADILPIELARVCVVLVRRTPHGRSLFSLPSYRQRAASGGDASWRHGRPMLDGVGSTSPARAIRNVDSESAARRSA